MAGAFRRLFFWNFKEKSINHFLWHSQKYWKGRTLPLRARNARNWRLAMKAFPPVRGSSSPFPLIFPTALCGWEAVRWEPASCGFGSGDGFP